MTCEIASIFVIQASTSYIELKLNLLTLVTGRNVNLREAKCGDHFFLIVVRRNFPWLLGDKAPQLSLRVCAEENLCFFARVARFWNFFFQNRTKGSKCWRKLSKHLLGGRALKCWHDLCRNRFLKHLSLSPLVFTNNVRNTLSFTFSPDT